MKNYSSVIFLALLIVFIISILVVKKWKIVGLEGFLEGYDYTLPIIINDKNNFFSYALFNPDTSNPTKKPFIKQDKYIGIGQYDFESFKNEIKEKTPFKISIDMTTDKITFSCDKRFKLFGTPSTIGPLMGIPNKTVDSSKNSSPYTFVSTNPFNNVPQTTTKRTRKPMQTKPMQTRPMKTRPMQTRPMKTRPMQTRPMQTTPMQTGPFQTTPMQTGPFQTTPMQTGPFQTTPMQTGPFQTTPMQTGPMQSITMPFQNTPMQTTPMQFQR